MIPIFPIFSFQDSTKSTKPPTDEDEEDENIPPPVGNGGATDRYTWTQTLQTCDCMIPVKPGSKSRDLLIDIKAGSLKVTYKNDVSNAIVEGQLYGKVKPEDCTWTLVDNKMVHVSFEKVDQMKWWATVIQGRRRRRIGFVQRIGGSRCGDGRLYW